MEPRITEQDSRSLSDASASAPAEAGPLDTLEWTVHPLRERPFAGAVLLLLVGLVVVLVRLNFPEFGVTVLAAGVLLAAVARFLFPTAYRFDATGITTRFLGVVRHHRWDTYRRVEEGPTGLFLSPFPTPHRLDNFRGLFLLYGDRRVAVTAFIRRQFGTAHPDAS